MAPLLNNAKHDCRALYGRTLPLRDVDYSQSDGRRGFGAGNLCPRHTAWTLALCSIAKLLHGGSTLTYAKKIDTAIVGGGQAGLAISYYLKQQGRKHVVLEREPAIVNAWRNQRWNSFTLVTPNFQVRMPGAEYVGSDPFGFRSRAEIVKYFDDYVDAFRLPVRCGVEVRSVEKSLQGYMVRTTKRDYEATNVVIATGLYQSPKIQGFRAAIPPSILQLHSMEYRSPSLLPPGAVLVVGTGQSGAQIAEELYQSGKKVYLWIGSAGRVPGGIVAGTLATGSLAWECSIRTLAN